MSGIDLYIFKHTFEGRKPYEFSSRKLMRHAGQWCPNQNRLVIPGRGSGRSYQLLGGIRPVVRYYQWVV